MSELSVAQWNENSREYNMPLSNYFVVSKDAIKVNFKICNRKNFLYIYI